MQYPNTSPSLLLCKTLCYYNAQPHPFSAKQRTLHELFHIGLYHHSFSLPLHVTFPKMTPQMVQQEFHEITTKRLAHQEKVRHRINAKLAPVPSFNIGDMVLLQKPKIHVRGTVIKSLRYAGPYVITRRRPDGLSFSIRSCEHGRELQNIHVARLIHFNVDAHIAPEHLAIKSVNA